MEGVTQIARELGKKKVPEAAGMVEVMVSILADGVRCAWVYSKDWLIYSKK